MERAVGSGDFSAGYIHVYSDVGDRVECLSSTRKVCVQTPSKTCLSTLCSIPPLQN